MGVRHGRRAGGCGCVYRSCTRSTDRHHSVHNVWNRRSLCGHCRVILPTYLPDDDTALSTRQPTLAHRVWRRIVGFG